MSIDVKKIVRAYADALAAEGKSLIDKAFETAEFRKNKTQNLHDSYGSCVFYDGKEVPNTRRYVGRRAAVGKRNPQGDLVLGRGEIDNYFDTYNATKKGFELVTVAAMFYAEELEKGSNLKRKYRVISGMSGDINDLAKRTGGRVSRINL